MEHSPCFCTYHSVSVPTTLSSAPTRLSLHLPDCLCTYQIVSAPTRLSLHLPDCLCTYQIVSAPTRLSVWTQRTKQKVNSLSWTRENQAPHFPSPATLWASVHPWHLIWHGDLRTDPWPLTSPCASGRSQPSLNVEAWHQDCNPSVFSAKYIDRCHSSKVQTPKYIKYKVHSHLNQSSFHSLILHSS